MPEFHIYSCRAECFADVARFLQAADAAGIYFSQFFIYKDTLQTQQGIVEIPDKTVEFHTPASLEELRAILNQQIDAHVMLQTLRPVPLAQNSLERMWDL